MSPEWVSATASLATVLVIAASALAALTQLRHMRSANQMASMLELRETVESPQFIESFRAALAFLSSQLADPEVRRTILTAEKLTLVPQFQQVLTVGNFFENAGCLVKNRIVDADLFCDLFSGIVLGAWKAYAPFIANRRIVAGKATYDNFEYLAVLSEDWLLAHPDGAYPPGVRRMVFQEIWPETAALTGDIK